MSQRFRNFQLQATKQALKSTVSQPHGSIITHGNEIVAWGYNSCRSKYCLGTSNVIDCCIHAEIAAAKMFLDTVVRRDPKKYCVLWGLQVEG
jgi:hypothetical protein